MPQDEGLDDAPFPDTLSALGGLPATPRPADEPPTPAEANAEVDLPDVRDAGGESRLDRLVSWVQWAAAPLGFFVFLVALTLFGLLKDEPTTETGNAPAANASAARVAAPSAATTVSGAPSTTAAPTTDPPATEPPPTQPQATQPPATEPPATQSPATQPAATEPPAPSEPAPVSQSAGRSTSPRFGPVCGYRPGQTVRIRINGQPAGTVTADAEGCVTVNR